MLHPLNALLKMNAFNWTPATDQAFHALKEAMCTTLVLALPDFKNTFVLECDASRKGIGAILMQEGRPMAFTNKQILEHHLGQSIYEKEMLAIYMLWIYGVLIYWANASKLKPIIRASSIFWNNAFPP
jgi:hypothetical protein